MSRFSDLFWKPFYQLVTCLDQSLIFLAPIGFSLSNGLATALPRGLGKAEQHLARGKACVGSTVSRQQVIGWQIWVKPLAMGLSNFRSISQQEAKQRTIQHLLGEISNRLCALESYFGCLIIEISMSGGCCYFVMHVFKENCVPPPRGFGTCLKEYAFTAPRPQRRVEVRRIYLPSSAGSSVGVQFNQHAAAGEREREKGYWFEKDTHALLRISHNHSPVLFYNQSSISDSAFSHYYL